MTNIAQFVHTLPKAIWLLTWGYLAMSTNVQRKKLSHLNPWLVRERERSESLFIDVTVQLMIDSNMR